MNHSVMWVDLSPEAEDALQDTPDTDAAILSVSGALMAYFSETLEDIPDINALYIADTDLLDSRVPLACAAKPRGYRKASGDVGWAVAILLPEQLSAIAALPNTERNAALLGVIDTNSAAAWVKQYGSNAQ